MSGPLSVLLIIGAAVVGPIEAQITDYDPLPAKNGIQNICVPPQVTGESSQGRCIDVRETLPQLCERAMREVGALVYRGKIQGQLAQDLRVPVRCIPTPVGYRK